MPPVALRSRTPTATAREYPTEQLGVDLLSLASYAPSPKSTLFTVLQRSTSSGCTLSAITMHSWKLSKTTGASDARDPHRSFPLGQKHFGRVGRDEALPCGMAQPSGGRPVLDNTNRQRPAGCPPRIAPALSRLGADPSLHGMKRVPPRHPRPAR